MAICWIIKMRLTYTFIILLLVVVPAHAGEFFENHEVSIGYAPFCYHFKNDGDLNENDNHAVQVAIDQWFAMTFRNSHHDRTFVAGYEFRTPKWEPFNEGTWFLRGGFPVGLMYGYKDHLPNVGGVTLAAAPLFEVGYKQFSVKTMVIPVGDIVVSSMFVWTF